MNTGSGGIGDTVNTSELEEVDRVIVSLNVGSSARMSLSYSLAGVDAHAQDCRHVLVNINVGLSFSIYNCSCSSVKRFSTSNGKGKLSG